METKLGNKVYAFTNWGLVKGEVVKERVDKYTGIMQYKLVIDIDKDNKGKDYSFWFTDSQLFKSKTSAVINLIKK